MPCHPFGLRKPCKNCPFLKDGAIALREGRVEGIVSDLLAGRATGFSCHKTVHNKRGGEWREDADGASTYVPSGAEQECAGALILLEKLGQSTAIMQIGKRLGVYEPENLRAHFDRVMEPGDLDGAHMDLPDYVKLALARGNCDDE